MHSANVIITVIDVKVHFLPVATVKNISQQIGCKFPSVGLRKISCSPEHKVPMSGQSMEKKEPGCLDLTVLWQVPLLQLTWDHMSCFPKQNNDREVPVGLYSRESPLRVQQCVWQLWLKLWWSSCTHSPVLLHVSMFKPRLGLFCNLIGLNSWSVI